MKLLELTSILKAPGVTSIAFRPGGWSLIS